MIFFKIFVSILDILKVIFIKINQMKSLFKAKIKPSNLLNYINYMSLRIRFSSIGSNINLYKFDTNFTVKYLRV